MSYAVIDIGANTIRLSIFAIEKEKPILLFNKKQTAGLANYNIDGELSQAGIDTLIKVLGKYQKILSYYRTEKDYIFATASLRNVGNSKEVIKKVKEELDIKIDLLNGKQEANLGFLGISTSVKNLESGITVDIGGGSTEIVYFKDEKIEDVFNLDDGCLSLHKKFVKGIVPTKEELDLISEYIDDKFIEFSDIPKDIDRLVGIGGTIRSTGKILKELNVTNNKNAFKVYDVYYLISLLNKNDQETYKSILKVSPDRIHTILTGLMIFKKICETFKIKDINVSNFGIREGYLIDKIK